MERRKAHCGSLDASCLRGSQFQNLRIQVEIAAKWKCLYGIPNARKPEESGEMDGALGGTHGVALNAITSSLLQLHNSYYQKWGTAFSNIQEWWPQPDPYAPHDLWEDKPHTDKLVGWQLVTLSPAHVQCRRTQKTPHGKLKPNLRCKYEFLETQPRCFLPMESCSTSLGKMVLKAPVLQLPKTQRLVADSYPYFGSIEHFEILRSGIIKKPWSNAEDSFSLSLNSLKAGSNLRKCCNSQHLIHQQSVSACDRVDWKTMLWVKANLNELVDAKPRRQYHSIMQKNDMPSSKLATSQRSWAADVF